MVHSYWCSNGGFLEHLKNLQLVELLVIMFKMHGASLNLTGITTIPTLGVTGIGTFGSNSWNRITLQEHGGVSIAWYYNDKHIIAGDGATIKYSNVSVVTTTVYNLTLECSWHNLVVADI